MASTLNEFYQSKGQALPSVADRTSDATKAGITGYVGSAEQNKSLLNYLKSTPNQQGNNVITADNVTTETPIKPPEQQTDSDSAGMIGSISSLLDTTKKDIKSQEEKYTNLAKQQADAIQSGGGAQEFEAKTYAEQGVDQRKKLTDSLVGEIEQDVLANNRRLENVRKTFKGTTAGLADEIARINRQSAMTLADKGIALSSASRNYETASNIATRLIESNNAKIKNDLDARQFVLGQLGTKLATEKANAFNLEIRQIDKQEQYYKEAIAYAKDAGESGVIDPDTAFEAIRQLATNKISISDFYDRLGGDASIGNINGYDITSYATDPTHELKVKSIYETMGDASTVESAEKTLKSLVPETKITGQMIKNSSDKYGVDPKLLIAMMQQDSSLGTQGMGARNNNPGNIAQYDDLKDAVEGYKTLDEGVDAVAKWLSNHRSKGVYKGEFLPVLETVAYSTSEPDKTKKSNLDRMKRYVSDGDYASAYKEIQNTVAKALPAEQKNEFIAKRTALPAIETLKEKLQAYENAGGKTGLLKGKFEDITNRLGEVSDPKYKALATDLKIAMQSYRSQMSGAAFSPQESVDYASVNPLGSNSLSLNLSILDGMSSNFQRRVDSIVDEIAGDGAQYIREYAQTGKTPKTGSTPAKTYSTPTGNSYQIIE